MKLKYFALFILFLAVFQLMGFLFFNIGITTINNQLIFGLVGNNALAIIISVVLLGFLYLIIPKTKSFYLCYFIISAAVTSNSLDRFIYGGVVDYIKIWFIPTFNLADIAIVVAIIIIFFQQIQKKTSNPTS